MSGKTATLCTMAVLGAAFGLLAMFYLVFPWALTLKGLGLSVEAQLIAQRVITPLVFVALGALAVSCDYFRRVLLQSGDKVGILVRVLRVVGRDGNSEDVQSVPGKPQELQHGGEKDIIHKK